EKVTGSANLLYELRNEICRLSLRSYSPQRFNKNIARIVEVFDSLKTPDEEKPRVGLVGEILVKYHPTANNDIVTLVEAEGAEAVVPDLIDFLLYSLLGFSFKYRYLAGRKAEAVASNVLISVIEFYRRTAKEVL